MICSAEEAISHVKSGQNIFIHSAAAVPRKLVNALSERHEELKGVNIYQIHTEGDAPYCREEMAGSFNIKALFVGPNMRKEIGRSHISYIPIFLSEAPSLFLDGIVPLDLALLSVSPPDKHGFCSLGPSVDISIAALRSAKKVIAQVNKYMPRTHGDGLIHVDNIDDMVYGDAPLPEVHLPDLDSNTLAIGRNVAELIEDGATLQMGIGAIPNAVLSFLGNHKNLGIHSEMFSDGVLPLVESGVINGRNKKKHPGVIVSSFVMGTRELYDFIDDNPHVKMIGSEYVNNTSVIRQNPKVTAINSAIEIDLTGQVCADSIGSRIISGVGGQMDFIRGASFSKGGKPIIAMSSCTKKGVSKIVPYLQQGAGVVTTRAHVHYVVTEFGVAYLYGKTIEERISALINIAHPDHREDLERKSHNLIG